MRVALVHYWLLGMRGGERVLESLCRMFPDADLFTLFYEPDRVSPVIRDRKVTASFLNPLRSRYRALLPLMPLALEQFDLRDYDLILSSESGPAKGVLAPSHARHICYCHTPMRYLWELYPAYRSDWTASRWKRMLMGPAAHYLRLWDYAAAARVDSFIANSETVRRRIWRAWRREASVVHPPVAVETFYWKPPEDYYLVVSALVPYKQVDLAVRFCGQSGRRLKIVGEGPDYRRLRKMASPGTEFCGRVSEAELRELYARCRAFLQPGEEDFGIAAVEALASGKPVIALGRGGACETVPRTPAGGVLYEPGCLAEAVRRFESLEARVNPRALQAWASRFSEQRFQDGVRAILGPELLLTGVPPQQHGAQSTPQDAEAKPHAPFPGKEQVEAEPLCVREAAASAHLPQPRDSRLHR